MKITIKVSMNKVVRFLIASDLAFATGWGFISPIFAVFITKQVSDGNLAVVGFSAAFYLITKSLLQPFIARFLDKNHGEIDDFYFLVGGLFLTGLVPLAYLVISEPWHLYLVQIVQGIGMACAVPTWAGIFTRHIDKGQEAFDWSIESTGLGLGAGIAGALGGVMASFLGFQFTFLFVSTFTMLSVIILFPVRPLIAPKGHQLIRPELLKKI